MDKREEKHSAAAAEVEAEQSTTQEKKEEAYPGGVPLTRAFLDKDIALVHRFQRAFAGFRRRGPSCRSGPVRAQVINRPV